MEKNEIHSGDDGREPMVVEGRNPVLELFESGRTIEKLYVQRGEREGSISKIFSLAKSQAVPVLEVDKKRLDALAQGNVHQGVAAVAGALSYVSLADMVSGARAKGQPPLIVV